MAIAGKTGGIWASDPTKDSVAFSNAATTPDDDGLRFQVTAETNRYWDPEKPVTVKVDGSEVTTGFELEPAGGFVVFKTAPGGAVTVSGYALEMVQAGGFFNWSLDVSVDEIDVSNFDSSMWKEFIASAKGWSGSAEAYWGDSLFFDALGKIVVVKLYVDSGPSQDCLEGYATINGDGIDVASDGVVEESIDFTGTGALYVRMEETEEEE